MWSEYTDMLLSGCTIRDAAKALGLNVATSFFWRHKILTAFKKLLIKSKPSLSGVIEADETYMALSFKGQRSNLPRPAKKRGSPANKRGISKEQVCVLTATTRNSLVFMRSVCLGRPS